MDDGNDGLLMALARHQTLVKALENAVGSPSGIGGFAEEIADHVVDLAGLAGLTLASGFVIAGAQSGL
ncbi:hypothetical protein [Methylomicrobium sp. Wu6]|uniref:hypothetical protein n=1 Tax=Methylomicrobium sp. Wu6 TaxID=3107928 RepID=UPI002DD6547D|nr:hypothetical protein [Methylomicrobium sp. Wu6]MEC4748937.1 hypothetical protein [Methylomicrobium sp. Wu6]